MAVMSKISLLFFLSWVFTSCSEKNEMLESISPSFSSINFRNDLPVNDQLNGFTFANYYNGGGVATGDINNDGLTDIYFTANSKGNNKLYLNKGNFEFEDITEKAGVAGTSEWCTGVTMADINGDGYLDIYVSAVNIAGKLQSKNELFINTGKSVFKESAASYGLDFSGFTTQT